MKSTILILMLISVIPTQMNAEATNKKADNKVESAEAKVMTDRLIEIKTMDKSTLTRTEKKHYVKK